jgi:benzylsuccinate CoA-transferase BbsE subunit
MSQETEGMLSPYRVLDLTDQGALLCGRILADLGADVITIEQPGGHSSRNIGPFYHDIPDPEKSLYWFVFNLNKRSITLDIETADGQELFKKLAKTTDFVLESFPPGYMDKLRVGYSTLSEINPCIILTSITPFGQTGPYKDFKAYDIVSWGMGGQMYTTGQLERPPVCITTPQASLNAALSAAAATLTAHYYREITGEGQHVDISAQAAECLTLANFIPYWEMYRINLRRIGSYLVGRTEGVKQRTVYRCKDGYVAFLIMGGRWGAKSNKIVTEWMSSEGTAPESMMKMNWDAFDILKQKQEIQDEWEEAVERFFLTKTKAELYEGALKRRMMLAPVANARDTVNSIQLLAREWWLQVEHPELNATLNYPGFFAKASKTPCRVRYRPPLIGEHNQQIYGDELGLRQEELIVLKQTKVI